VTGVNMATQPDAPDLSLHTNETRAASRLHNVKLNMRSGELKGDGKITYDDAFAAGSAVDLFNGKEFEGVVRNFFTAMRSQCATTIAAMRSTPYKQHAHLVQRRMHMVRCRQRSRGKSCPKEE
jgi:hypothetical protein